jgi:hypothetical protein
MLALGTEKDRIRGIKVHIWLHTLALENGHRTWHSRLSDRSLTSASTEETLNANTIDLHRGEANSAVILLSISRKVTNSVLLFIIDSNVPEGRS